MTLTTLMGAALCATGPLVDQSLDCPRSGACIGESVGHSDFEAINDDSLIKSFIPDTEFVVRYGRRSQRWESRFDRQDEMRAMVNFRWELGSSRSHVADSFIGIEPPLAGEDELDSVEWEAQVFDCLDHIERSRRVLGGQQ